MRSAGASGATAGGTSPSFRSTSRRDRSTASTSIFTVTPPPGAGLATAISTYRTLRASGLFSISSLPAGLAVVFTFPCDGSSGGSGRKIIHLFAAKVVVRSS